MTAMSCNVYAKPWALFAARPSDLQQVVENRFQKIDRHKHVAGNWRRSFDCIMHHKRADADQFTVLIDERSAAEPAQWRRGKNCVVEQVFPVAGKFADICHFNELKVVRPDMRNDQGGVVGSERGRTA